MKLEIWTKECLNEFFRVTGDVFHSISFQGRKKDIYIWYNALPISLPTFWPNSGWGEAAGRVPVEEKALFITQDKDIAAVQQKLAELNRKIVIPNLDNLKNIKDLDAAFNISTAPGSAYPKAMCKFMLGKYELGREIIDAYIDFRVQQLKDCEVKNPLSHIETKEYLIDLSNDEIEKELMLFKAINIKKYRLKKFMSQAEK